MAIACPGRSDWIPAVTTISPGLMPPSRTMLSDVYRSTTTGANDTVWPVGSTVALVQRAPRQQDDVAALEMPGADHHGAERHGRRRPGNAHLDLDGPGVGVDRRRDFPHGARGGHPGIGHQPMLTLQSPETCEKIGAGRREDPQLARVVRRCDNPCSQRRD
jgi:hypothetical protein